MARKAKDEARQQRGQYQGQRHLAKGILRVSAQDVRGLLDGRVNLLQGRHARPHRSRQAAHRVGGDDDKGRAHQRQGHTHKVQRATDCQQDHAQGQPPTRVFFRAENQRTQKDVDNSQQGRRKLEKDLDVLGKLKDGVAPKATRQAAAKGCDGRTDVGYQVKGRQVDALRQQYPSGALVLAHEPRKNSQRQADAPQQVIQPNFPQRLVQKTEAQAQRRAQGQDDDLLAPFGKRSARQKYRQQRVQRDHHRRGRGAKGQHKANAQNGPGDCAAQVRAKIQHRFAAEILAHHQKSDDHARQRGDGRGHDAEKGGVQDGFHAARDHQAPPL